MKTIDFWFDYTCPYAYLASTQIEGLAHRAGARLRWRPMLLGGVFGAVGTPQRLFATLSPQKARHGARDLERWASRFGVPLHVPAGHPLRTVEALRATLATGCDPAVIHGLFAAYFRAGRCPSDEDVLRAVLSGAGHDAEEVLAATRSDKFRAALRAETDEAVRIGIFGAPACVVDGEIFWGQDRLDALAEALGIPPSRARWNGPRAAPPPLRSRPAPRLRIYYDYSSPWAYLGVERVRAVLERTRAEAVWCPILLGGLFRDLGQVDVPLLAMSAPKRAYTLRDLEREARRAGLPFRFPTRFPLRSVQLLRVELALEAAPARDAFRRLAMRGVWAEDADPSDPATLRAWVAGALDAARAEVSVEDILVRSESLEIKDALREATTHAGRAGVFGVPTFVVGDDDAQLYWGQDRLGLVEDALVAG
jgi:2-hydroxychromene-2-carboxylate isomerase